MFGMIRGTFPPPETVSKREAQVDPATALHAAIAAGREADARKVMDNVFWEKSTFRPNWLHLFHAVMQNDRDMARLLVTWGATFEKDEAKTLARLTGSDWKKATAILKGVGIQTEFSAEELAKTDNQMMVRMTRHAIEFLPVDEHRNRFAEYLNDAFEDAFTTAVLARDSKAVYAILAEAGFDPADKPANIDRIIERLCAQDPAKAVDFARNAVNDLMLILKPIVLSPDTVMKYPCVIDPLAKMNALAADQSHARDYIFIASEQTDSKDVVSALPHLFNNRFPLTNVDAERVVTILSQNSHKPAAAKLEAALLEAGFVSGPAWKPEDLKKLGRGDEGLKEKFTRIAAKRAFESQSLKDFFGSEEKILSLKETLSAGIATLNADQVLDVLKFLQDRSDEGRKTAEAVEVLSSLCQNGSDFSKVDPMDYLGKKAPGVARVLLDQGIVEAKHFQLETILDRSGKPFEIGKTPEHKRYAYTEFLCQLILENNDTTGYVQYRGKKDTCYQDIFRRDWFDRGRYRITFEQEQRVEKKKTSRWPIPGRKP